MHSYEDIVGQFSNQMLRLMPGHIPDNFQDVLNRLYAFLHSTVTVESNLSHLLHDFIIKNCSDWQFNMNPDIDINVNISRQLDVATAIVDALEREKS